LTPSRLLLIAQSPVWRYALRMVVQSSWPQVESTEAEHALAAFKTAPEFGPDLTIIQDALPGVSGMIAGRMVRQLAPEGRVIVLTDDVDVALGAVGGAGGVDAVLPSAVEPDDLAAAILSFEHLRPEVPDVTPLDVAVLDGVARGLSLDAIQAGVGVDLSDVVASLTALHRQFDSADALTLVANAVRRGWVDLHAHPPGGGAAITFAVAA
jgi:DNA-binding NarL/FixJ family response regulator